MIVSFMFGVVFVVCLGMGFYTAAFKSLFIIYNVLHPESKIEMELGQ